MTINKNNMSFNLVKLDAAEFSVDAYTEAVEGEFAVEFFIDNYTAAVEAEFLQIWMTTKTPTSRSMMMRWVGVEKKIPECF